MLKAQAGAVASNESRMFLKTIRALTRPRGFESHALRSTRQNQPWAWAGTQINTTHK